MSSDKRHDPAWKKKLNTAIKEQKDKKITEIFEPDDYEEE